MSEASRHGGSAEREDEVSLVYLVNVVLRHRDLVWKWPVGLTVLLLGFSLLTPAQYTSSVTFLPQTEQPRMSGLAGLASQFGLDVPSSLQGGRSPQFYAALLHSRELLVELVETRFPAMEVEDGPPGGTLIEYYGIDDASDARRRVEAVEELRRHIEVGTNPQTSTVEFGVTTKRPELSHQVARELVRLVNRFDLETRQSQAEAERKFLEERVEAARGDLTAAEDSLERFLEQNRQYQNSPELRFTYERLQRRVTLRQQVYTTLAQSYEQARIEEVRNTPVVTVVESPEVPAKPDARRFVLKAVLGLTFGLVLGIAGAFVREFFSVASGRDAEHVREFRRLLREIRENVRERWHRARRRLGRS